MDAVGGRSEALHDGGMGGGTRAGMTPAFDTPSVCPEKKLIVLRR